MKRAALRLALTPGTLLAAACTVGPDYVPPALDVPQAWVEPGTAAGPLEAAWWQSFGDPELASLVDRATEANLDVRIAIAHLREARAARGVAVAALFPQVDTSAAYSNSRFSQNGFLQGLGGGGLPGAVGPGQEINLYNAALDGSWELDVFGGRRRAVEAASAEVTAAELDVADVLRAISADVAEAYVQLRGIQARIGVATHMIASQDRTVAIVREWNGAGVVSDLDLSRAESQAATSAASLPELEAAERVTVRRIEVLLAARPGTLDAELAPVAAIPTPPDALSAGIPSEVLRRRPDVRAAERRLAASTARIGEATAAYFPRFSLTGSFGLQSQEIKDLADADSRFWIVGPTVRWPILDFGRIRSNVEIQDAKTMAAEAEYEATVVRALSQVEIALVALARERRRHADLVRAAEAADRSVQTAEELYRSGLLEYTDLLDTQRTQDAALDAEIRSRSLIAGYSIGLFKALGGGWVVTGEAGAAGDGPAVASR